MCKKKNLDRLKILYSTLWHRVAKILLVLSGGFSCVCLPEHWSFAPLIIGWVSLHAPHFLIHVQVNEVGSWEWERPQVWIDLNSNWNTKPVLLFLNRLEPCESSYIVVTIWIFHFVICREHNLTSTGGRGQRERFSTNHLFLNKQQTSDTENMSS